MPIRLRRAVLIASLLLAPAATSARDVTLCANLYRQLNNAPVMIGNTGDMRRYNMELTQQYNEIRRLRIELRQAGCSSGSVVVFGNRTDQTCQQMEERLRQMESTHENVKAERDDARKEMVKPSAERVAALAAIRQNACTPADVEEAQKERLKVRGIELPKEEPYSGITDLRSRKPGVTPAATQASAQPAPPRQPDRPYDPTRKVRMVGPIFLPEASIDLANPKSSGPQPEQ